MNLSIILFLIGILGFILNRKNIILMTNSCFYLLQYIFEAVTYLNIEINSLNISSFFEMQNENLILMLNISNIFFLSGLFLISFLICLHLINLIVLLLIQVSSSRLVLIGLNFLKLNFYFFILSKINYYLFILQWLNNIIVENVTIYASSISTMLLNFVKKSRVYFKIWSYLRWLIIFYFCYLDLNNIFIILIPVLLFRLGIGLFLKYLFPKITNKNLKTLLLFLLVIISLIWSLYLCYVIWNFFIFSGIMLELLPFLLLFAKNVLLVNDNLYCESLFWSETFCGAHTHTDDFKTVEQICLSSFPRYEITPLNVRVFKESVENPVWEKIVNNCSIFNYNLIAGFSLDLLKNIISSSLMFYMDPDPEIETIELDQKSFDYLLNKKFEDIIDEVDLILEKPESLSDDYKKNIYLYYVDRAFLHEKTVTTDLIEEALLRNRYITESKRTISTVLENVVNILIGKGLSAEFEDFTFGLKYNLNIKDSLIDPLNDEIESKKLARISGNGLENVKFYAPYEIELFKGISEDLRFIFNKAPNPIIQSLNGQTSPIPLDLILLIKEFTLKEIMNEGYDSIKIIRDKWYEDIENKMTYYFHRNSDKWDNLSDLKFILDGLKWCYPSQELPLILLVSHQYDFTIPISEGDEADTIPEYIKDLLKEEFDVDNFQDLARKYELEHNSEPNNRKSSFFSKFEFSHIRNTFRFRDRSFFKPIDFVESLVEEEMTGPIKRVPLSTPISDHSDKESHSPILTYVGKIHWNNTDRLITSHNIHNVSNYLNTLPLNANDQVIIKQKYIDID
jgi:hypothetical protein